MNLVVLRQAFIGEVGKDVVIVDDAILENFDERSAFVCTRFLQDAKQLLLCRVDTARNKACARTDGKLRRQQRQIDGSQPL